MYIWEQQDWPHLTWDDGRLLEPLAAARLKQGRFLGSMARLGFDLKLEAQLEALTEDVIKSSEIEGEVFDRDSVRSSIARRLGVPAAAVVPADRLTEGVVEMMLDATENYEALLTPERLFGWQASLFPTGYSGMHKVKTGAWRGRRGRADAGRFGGDRSSAGALSGATGPATRRRGAGVPGLVQSPERTRRPAARRSRASLVRDYPPVRGRQRARRACDRGSSAGTVGGLRDSASTACLVRSERNGPIITTCLNARRRARSTSPIGWLGSSTAFLARSTVPRRFAPMFCARPTSGSATPARLLTNDRR